MIPLPPDSLVFKLAGNDAIPCAAGSVQFELVGDGTETLDTELLRNAAAGVLHYFRHELKRSTVSAEEFSAALETVLHSFGLNHIKADPCPAAERRPVAEADLSVLAADGLELLFFQRLREELRRQLRPVPGMVRFHGLRACVKRLAGAKRWCRRCQNLHDHIVEYLRAALGAEPITEPCGLVVL